MDGMANIVPSPNMEKHGGGWPRVTWQSKLRKKVGENVF
jgi:hypothetical protein